MPLNNKLLPFTDNDLLPDLMEQDNDYLKARTASFVKIKQKNNKNNIYMSIQKQFTNSMSIFAKNTALASLAIFTVLTTVGVGATEIFAPDEFKLSTLFSANKQPDKNPYTALKPDDKNDVAKFEECDISMKFPKTIQGKPVTAINYGTDPDNVSINYALERNDIEKTSPNSTTQTTINRIDVSCLDANKKDLSDMMNSLEQSKNNAKKEEEFKVEKLTKDGLREKHGWFITEAEIQNIYFVSYRMQETDFTTMQQGNWNILHESYYFKYSSKWYYISNIGKTADSSAITFADVQIQFNSIVKNEDNVTVMKKTT